MVASPRTALREKLLKIVGLLPDGAAEAAGRSEAFRKPLEGGCSVLLLDHGIDDLGAGDLVAVIRGSHPEVNVAFVNHERELKELPCEFGNGHFREHREGGSPVARAAAAHWHCIERAFVLAQSINQICAEHLATPSGKA
jgi:hypothetical protein